MRKFDDIYEGKVQLKNYTRALQGLKESIINDVDKKFENNTIVKMYYMNALKMAVDNNFFNDTITTKVNLINECLSDFTSQNTTQENIVNNISIILEELEVKNQNSLKIPLSNFKNEKVELLLETTGVAIQQGTPASVNGMGEVKLPSVDGVEGSGDIPNAKGATDSDKKEEGCKDEDGVIQENSRPKLKKFNDIHEESLLEKEIFFPVNDFGDTASLIAIMNKNIQDKFNVNDLKIQQELNNIFISYNGIVDIKSLRMLSNIINQPTNKIKKVIDQTITDNLHLLEELQLECLQRLLNGEDTLNEGIIGRALGAIGGFALGPKIGKLIAKVLGIEKGAIYNLLTSRVVGAALAQALTKNLI